jgi:hypothetical protein
MYNIDEIKKNRKLTNNITQEVCNRKIRVDVQTNKFFSPKAHNKSKRTRRRRGMKIIVVGEGA